MKYWILAVALLSSVACDEKKDEGLKDAAVVTDSAALPADSTAVDTLADGEVAEVAVSDSAVVEVAAEVAAEVASDVAALDVAPEVAPATDVTLATDVTAAD